MNRILIVAVALLFLVGCAKPADPALAGPASEKNQAPAQLGEPAQDLLDKEIDTGFDTSQFDSIDSDLSAIDSMDFD